MGYRRESSVLDNLHVLRNVEKWAKIHPASNFFDRNYFPVMASYLENSLIKQGLLRRESDGIYHVTPKGYKYLAEHSHSPRRQAYARKKRGY